MIETNLEADLWIRVYASMMPSTNSEWAQRCADEAVEALRERLPNLAIPHHEYRESKETSYAEGRRAALVDVERELKMAGRYTDDVRRTLAKLRGEQ